MRQGRHTGLRHLRLPMVLFGAALLAGLALWAGLPAVLRAVATLRPWGFALVVLIHLPVIVLMGAAWWSIGRAGGPSLSSFVQARLVRDAVAELLPFSQAGGFAAGIRLLSLTGVPVRAAGLSLFADLLMEFFSKLLYAVAGVALLICLRPGGPLPAYLLATLGLLGGTAIFLLVFRGPLDAFDGLNSYLALDRLVPSGLLHALCWALGGVEAWVTLRLMGVAVTVPEALAIDSLVTSLRTFGFWVPAALGVQEAAYVLGAGLFGLGPSVAIAFSLVRRARDLVVGLIGIAVWQGMEMARGRRARIPDLKAAAEPPT